MKCSVVEKIHYRHPLIHYRQLHQGYVHHHNNNNRYSRELLSSIVQNFSINRTQQLSQVIPPMSTRNNNKEINNKLEKT